MTIPDDIQATAERCAANITGLSMPRPFDISIIARALMAERAARDAEISMLREKLASAYIDASGRTEHWSDCATSRAPAFEPGPCDCSAMLAAAEGKPHD